jgi:hypothetical protein
MNLINNILKKDNANNGLMTKVWGPPGWMFLHSITMGYPIKINDYDEKHIIRKNQMKIFFESIGHVFPCKYCRQSYIKFIKELPIDNYLNSRKNLVLWFYKIHNKVNNKLGVPQCDIPSFESIYKEYDSYRAECTKTTSKERIKNLNKGCVVPKDGKKRKCVVKVIQINNINYLKYIILISIIILFIIYLFLNYKCKKL